MSDSLKMVAGPQLRRRQLMATLFRLVCAGVTFFAVVILGVLIYRVTSDGLPWLDAQFLSSLPSRFPEKAGIKSALVGTIWLVAMTAAFAIPTGVLAAIYLEEYAPKNRFTQFIEVNLSLIHI